MNNENCLIIGASWVGDMVMSQPLFKTLKMQDANRNIDVLAPTWTHGILARMPEINQAITMPLGHGKLALKQRYQLGKQLRAQHYDHAIVIPNSWKSALIPYFANIPVRTGWLGEMRYGLVNDWRKLDKSNYPLMLQRLVALAYPKAFTLPDQLPTPQLLCLAESRNETLTRLSLRPEQRPILALCPGAQFGPAKQWPATHFATVANYFLDNGWQCWLFGSKADETICQTIQQHTHSRCVNLSGKTALSEAIDLMSLSHAVVSNDSGLMHIAAALNKPLVALYGSSSPDFTPPLNTQATILSLRLDCSPCFKRTCPLEHLNCLIKLNPKQVIAAIEQLIERDVKHD